MLPAIRTLRTDFGLPALAPAVMFLEHRGDPRHEIVDFDDGTVRLRGAVPPEARAQFEKSYIDTGMLIDGWSVWMPKEAGDDA